ncbi:MAG: hypothetical protein RLY57_352, partial [Candidatus Parcubacteria bacterium]
AYKKHDPRSTDEAASIRSNEAYVFASGTEFGHEDELSVVHESYVESLLLS